MEAGVPVRTGQGGDVASIADADDPLGFGDDVPAMRADIEALVRMQSIEMEPLVGLDELSATFNAGNVSET
ncbi:MAG: hypothetical protein E5X00_23630, partial [Mesorhizobium sp.]